MKNSGIEWIGEIPDDWEVTKILNCLRKRISDGPHETPTYVEKGIPFISVDSLNETEYVDLSFVNRYISEEDYLEYSKKANLEENDILFSKAATIGKTAIVHADEKFMVWSPIAILKTNNRLDNRFLYYLLNYDGLITHISFLGSINTQINVGMRELEQARISLPPKSTQQRIASYLDKKCSKIEETIQNQQQVIEKLKAYKQSLITEAVTGKVKIVNGKVCGEYESYKDSGVEWIGEIPSGWEVGKTGMFTYVTKLAGFEFTDIMMDKISENGDVPIVRAQNVRMFKFNKEIINEYIDLSTSNTLNRCCLDKKCLLITFIGAGIGDICIFDESIRYHLAPNVAKIEIRNFAKTKLCEEFLMYYIGSEPGKREIANISKVAAQPSLSMETIRKIKLCIPPFEEQKLIVDYLYPKCLSIDKTIEQKQELIVKLTEYKKSLIYECVTGKKEI